MKAVKFIFVFFIITSLQNCIGDDILDDTINEVLSFTNSSLEDGKTQELTIKDSFQYETDFLNNVGKRETPTITWSSSDSDVISITNTGLATALKIGTSTIRASVLDKDGKPLINKDGEPVISEQKVMVVKTEEKLVIDNLIEDLTVNTTHQYTTTYTNDLGEIETPQITWSSSDEAIISVSSTGLITAKSVGQATITALVTVGGKDVTSEDIVTTAGVTERLSIDNPVENLTINTTHQYTTTYTNNLGVVETPQITWSSSDEAMISVSDAGLITAKSIGQATITALVTVNGRKITSEDTVTVVGVAERLSIDNPIENLTINTTHQYTTTYTNDLGEIETPQITWSSSDEAIISVSDTGLITAKSIGQATITASVTINSIDVTSEDTVTVVGVAERLSINNPIENLTINTTHQYTTTYTNSSGVIETPQITWSSSDEAVISVSNTGLITAKSIGQATITASVTINGIDVTSEDIVTTVGVAEELNIDNLIENLTINTTHQYTTTYTNNLGVIETPQITWSSSDEAIISVSDTGLITAKSIGQATITALVNVNGRDITSEDDVTIVGIPETLSINNPISELNANNNETHQYTVTYTDETGQTQTPPQITWTSSDTSIATVSNTGLVSAINDQTATTGPVTITATATSSTGQTISDEDTITITATIQEKTGTIRTTSGYALTGTFTLREISGTNNLELSINADYNASSSLPGLYLYLTNNPNSINNALEIGKVTVFSGAHTYTISNTGINDFNHLLYWCKPFSVKVGDGEINN